jgi:hypothetical protein
MKTIETTSSWNFSLKMTKQITKTWLIHKFKFNEDKTEVLLVYAASSRRKPAPTPLMVGGETVHLATTVRNLGVALDAHVRSIYKKAFFYLYRISRIRKYLTQTATRQLVYSFVPSQLDYGNSLLAGLPTVRLERLQRVQNAAARLTIGSRRYDPILHI